MRKIRWSLILIMFLMIMGLCISLFIWPTNGGKVVTSAISSSEAVIDKPTANIEHNVPVSDRIEGLNSNFIPDTTRYGLAEIVGTLPHLPINSLGELPFTQALEVIKDTSGLKCIEQDSTYLIETTGLWDTSAVIIYRLQYNTDDSHLDRQHCEMGICAGAGASKVYKLTKVGQLSLPAGYFSEGLIVEERGVEQDRLTFLMITWRNYKWLQGSIECQDGNVHLRWLKEGKFPYEGWGLAVGKAGPDSVVWFTDGSKKLRKIKNYQRIFQGVGSNDRVWKEVQEVVMTCNGQAMHGFNELHYHSIRETLLGMVLGHENVIVEVDTASGRCISSVDLSGIGSFFKNSYDVNSVFNGVVALKEESRMENDVFLVTGKHWPSMFIITVKLL